MTVHTEAAPSGRWGIYRRGHRREPWALVVHTGDKHAAEKLLVSLAADSKTSGDWRVGPVEPGSMSPAAAGRGQ